MKTNKSTIWFFAWKILEWNTCKMDQWGIMQKLLLRKPYIEYPQNFSKKAYNYLQESFKYCFYWAIVICSIVLRLSFSEMSYWWCQVMSKNKLYRCTVPSFNEDKDVTLSTKPENRLNYQPIFTYWSWNITSIWTTGSTGSYMTW
jgi:hypothetical protein